MNKQPELHFNPNSVQSTIGLRIRDLPESCTNELLYTQVFQKQKIDTKKVKAFKVKGHKTFQNCLGDAIVYFDSEDSAQDAMSKIIGQKLHNKTINCSLMMPSQDLKLKNGKNVYVKNLKSTVTLQTFYKAAQVHGQVLSILLKQNALGKFDGYACYKTQTFAELAEKSGIKIDEEVYSAKVLKIEDKNTIKKGTMSTNSRNIELHFDISLVNEKFDEADFENQLRAQIVEKFNLQPTSLFVWGKRARHFAKHSDQTLQDAFNLVNAETIKQCGNTNAKGEHLCHEQPYETTCPVLSYFHKKAFVCFDLKNEAQDFLNQYYGKYCSDTASAEDKNLFNFVFKKDDKVIEARTVRCIPEQATMDKKYKELEEKLNPKVLDKNFIFLKNLKKDTTIEQITAAIETNCKTKVVSVKMGTPNTATYIRDVSKVTETKFATIQLENVQESESFINQFKQFPEFRDKFQLFEGYKYANYLAPKKLHKQDLKVKNEKTKKQQNKQPQIMPNPLFNPQMLPFFFTGLNNKMMIPPMFNKGFPMIPPMANNQRGTYPMNNQFNNNNMFRPQNNQNRNTSLPSHGNFNQQNKPQNNNLNYNNNMNNNNFKQNRGQSTTGGKPMNNNNNNNQNNNNRGQVQLGKPFNQNYRGTTYPQQQQQQQQNRQQQNRNNLNKPSNQPQKVAGVQAPLTAPVKQPVNQPPQAPKPLIPKLEDLVDKTDEVKKQILGQALLPKISAELQESDRPHTNKIAGMLLDFEIYSPEEIIGMLTNVEELKDNISTALELIQEATAQ